MRKSKGTLSADSDAVHWEPGSGSDGTHRGRARPVCAVLPTVAKRDGLCLRAEGSTSGADCAEIQEQRAVQCAGQCSDLLCAAAATECRAGLSSFGEHGEVRQ